MAGRVRGVSGHTRVAIEHGWEVAATPAGERDSPAELDRLAWHPARVPGTAASALPDHGNYDALDWWWRAPLNPELTAGTTLGFDGIATLWDAWVDGVHVASADSMWATREATLEHGAHELVIRCRSLAAELAIKRPRPRWRVPMLEQQQLRWIRTTLLGRTPGWSPPCPAVGPWRGVWIEQRVHAVGDIWLDARLDGDDGIVEVRGIAGNVVVTRGGERFAGGRVPHVARWWPHTHGEPALYHVSIEADGFTADLGHTGFRTVELEDDSRVRINGVPIFCRGACWTPLDARTLTGNHDAAIRQVVRGGMNMLRVTGTMTYEADAFHDALDAHGVLLWQDLMFANMDYPIELADVVRTEVRAETARLQARPSLAVICGNSEAEQQAAMWGATRDRWESPLFHAVIPEVVHAVLPRVPYVPSSACGGAFPHASNVGPSSYYGVGAYRRPLEDARRADVRFASECLAFANLPVDGATTAPRDLGASWDFADVRDHYVQVLFGVDPKALEPARYLELGRVATGEVMARTFGEWRRARSVTGGGLVWFLRDLQPGAGWGLLDADGMPKPAWWIVRRSLQPVAIAITDEGTNGLAVHVANDRAEPYVGAIELVLWRDGTTCVGRATREIAVPARGAIELAAGAWFDHFVDLSWAYRFGPPTAHAIHASLVQGGVVECDAFWFPASLEPRADGLTIDRVDDHTLAVHATTLATFVELDASLGPDDNYFHLAPGQTRIIKLAL